MNAPTDPPAKIKIKNRDVELINIYVPNGNPVDTEKYDFKLNWIDLLTKEIKKLPSLKKLVIIGHSYGGVLVTSMVENWESNLPTEIHSIAGPVGSAFSRNACTFDPPERIPNKLAFYQWKTQHHLDVAFKRLKNDPQDLKLSGSKITRLPESYRGRRLGHNWSISWVADKLGPLN